MAKGLQQQVQRMARLCADTVELEEQAGGFVLRFRYGRESEPFPLRGATDKEKLRDLGVQVEKFMGAR
jgi:hypothetical protein